jgi:hypothetical protein
MKTSPQDGNAPPKIESVPTLPPKSAIEYTLAPLVQDGRNCLACGDVEGMGWVILEWVEVYHGGSPWQRITRESDDIFALLENDILKWPPLDRITAARFRLRLKADQRARRLTVRPAIGRKGKSNGPGLVMEEWLTKRNFVKVQRCEGKSLE